MSTTKAKISRRMANKVHRNQPVFASDLNCFVCLFVFCTRDLGYERTLYKCLSLHGLDPKTFPKETRREKACLWGVANNKGADQPVHPRSLISVFIFRFLQSIISKLAT